MESKDVTLSPESVAKLVNTAHLISSGEVVGSEAFQLILKLSIDFTSADFGTIHLYDKESDTLRLAAYVGESSEFPQKPPYGVSYGITGKALQYKKPIFVTDVFQDPDYVQLFSEARSELVVPIFFQSDVVGVINLESSRTNGFSAGDMRMIELLASILAAAFHKAEIERLRSEIDISKSGADADTAFVLTPFRDPFNKYYTTIIKPAIKSTGLISLRADEIFTPNEIIKDIWSAINKARVVIAELTTRNPNVMYELGLSHAVNKPVVMISQSIDDVPFDLRGLRCILYDTTEPDWAKKLRTGIASFITSVLNGRASSGPF